MTCEEFQARVLKFAQLTRGERAIFGRHIGFCDSCFAKLEALFAEKGVNPSDEQFIVGQRSFLEDLKDPEYREVLFAKPK